MWYTRTVKNGKIKINGVLYHPSDTHRPYNNELEGRRCLFGDYTNTNFVYFWGTQHMNDYTRNARAIDIPYDMTNEPNVIDGFIYWQWWFPEGEDQVCL